MHNLMIYHGKSKPTGETGWLTGYAMYFYIYRHLGSNLCLGLTSWMVSETLDKYPPLSLMFLIYKMGTCH